MADLNPDEGFPPVPALSQPLDADEELRLEDALADEPEQVVATDPPAPLGRAPAYYFVTHTMLPPRAGGPSMTHGLDTLRAWIEKCVRTRRGENPACDPDFGLDIIAEDLLEEGVPYDAAAVAEYLAALERGLTVDPRIDSIDDPELIYDDPDRADATLRFRVVTVGDDVPDLTFDSLAVLG